MRPNAVRGDRRSRPGQARLPGSSGEDRAFRRRWRERLRPPRGGWRTLMETVDGNAIGGLLYDLFGTEMTAATGTCARCGATAQLAEFVVYLRAPGTVARCRNCLAVLMVVTHVRDMNCVDLRGLARIEHGRT